MNFQNRLDYIATNLRSNMLFRLNAVIFLVCIGVLDRIIGNNSLLLLGFIGIPLWVYGIYRTYNTAMNRHDQLSTGQAVANPHNTKRIFLQCLVLFLLAFIISIADNFYNKLNPPSTIRSRPTSISQAESTVRAELIGRNSQDFSGITRQILNESEPDIIWTEQSIVSIDKSTVSIKTGKDTFGLASHPDENCYYILLRASAPTLYGANRSNACSAKNAETYAVYTNRQDGWAIRQ